MKLVRRNVAVDGAVLLSTVGIQSIIILLNEIYTDFPVVISIVVIMIGLVFYCIGIGLIGRFYITNTWNIADHWANTNCIIHGALSITGLALLTANIPYPIFITCLWVVTFILLLFVEMMEIIRLIQRIRKYTVGHAIGVYHVSQWSRNFTFGMFFAFTWKMVQVDDMFVIAWQKNLLSVWVWIVFAMLAIETGLCMLHFSRKILNMKKVKIK